MILTAHGPTIGFVTLQLCGLRFEVDPATCFIIGIKMEVAAVRRKALNIKTFTMGI
jgi:hypothetical protein